MEQRETETWSTVASTLQKQSDQWGSFSCTQIRPPRKDSIIAITTFIEETFLFLQYWGLNPGPHPYQASTLTLRYAHACGKIF